MTVQRNYLYSLETSESRLARLQDQLTTGKLFVRPQDDPIGVERSIALRHHISINEQFLRNAQRASTWMSQIEQALDDTTKILNRAHELTLAAANAATPDDARAHTAMEIVQLREEILSISQRSMEGRLIFQGTLPVWRVGPGLDMAIDDVDGLRDLLSKIGNDLTALETQLKDSSLSELQDSLTVLTSSMDQVLSHRAANGARMNRLEMLDGKMTSLDIEYRRLLSDAEDVDLTQLLVNLRSAEAAYEAALGVGARLIQPTLLDYLR